MNLGKDYSQITLITLIVPNEYLDRFLIHVITVNAYAFTFSLWMFKLNNNNKRMHENKALLFENASLKLYNDWDQSRLQAATSIVYQWSIINCMGIFHSLNTFYQLENGSIFPPKESWDDFASGCLWVVFLPFENSLQINIQKDCCFGCTVNPHIFYLLTVSRQDSWNMVAQDSPSLTMAVVHCVMAMDYII